MNLFTIVFCSFIFTFGYLNSCQPIADDPDVTEQTGRQGFSSEDDISSGACGNYQGYDGDVQYSTQCKMAQMYKCQGNQDGVTLACMNIDGFRDDNPDLPACPYCN